MFKNAHDGQEITSMCFDPTKRRLITGSRNGSTKIWNFNNGACLRVFDPLYDGEITGEKFLTVDYSLNTENISMYKEIQSLTIMNIHTL